MVKVSPAKYEPDVAIPPGETIREMLRELGMTQSELASRMARPANKVNEITDITETAGPTWVTPAYGGAGTMTTLPQLPA